MQTPTDTIAEELQGDDLPYAGLLALQSMLYAWGRDLTDRFSIYIGAVDPVNLAGQARKTIHSLIDSDRPNGWDDRLENELVRKLEAQRVWKVCRRYSERGGGFDILGIAGSSRSWRSSSRVRIAAPAICTKPRCRT